MHIWGKFGDSSSNSSQVIARTSQISRIQSQSGENDFEGQGQGPPFLIPTESIPGHMFVANLLTLTQMRTTRIS